MKKLFLFSAQLLISVTILQAQSSAEYLSNKDNFCISTGSFQGNWELIGPISMPLQNTQPNWKFHAGLNDLYISINDDPVSTNDYTPQGLSGPDFNNNIDAVSAFDVSPLDKERIYVAFDGAGDWGGSPHFMDQFFYNDPSDGWVNRTPGQPTECMACSTCNAYATCWNAITDVVSDPNNYERVWICFRGFDFDVDGTLSDEKKAGVMYSDDAGTTWHSMNTGLPNFPVNCIRYQNGTDDILYVGTDGGVFKWVHTAGQAAWIGEWECFSNGLPACMVRDMEINYCSSKLRIASLGRGIWESDLSEPNVLTINSNTTWRCQ